MSDTELDKTNPEKIPVSDDIPTRPFSPPAFNPYPNPDNIPFSSQMNTREDSDLVDTFRPPNSILKNADKYDTILEATEQLKNSQDRLEEILANQNLINRRSRSSSLPSKNRMRSRSPAFSRQASRDSIFNIIDAVDEVTGLTRQLQPLAAAGRIGLNPAKYSEEVKRRVAKDISAQAKPEAVRRNFQDEINRFDYSTQFMDAPPKLHDNIQSTVRAPLSNVKAFNEKLRSYNKKQRADSDTIADFVKDFVGAVNAFELNEKQANEIFPGYFEGSLRHEIEQDIISQGLQRTINRLFQFKCAQSTRQELKLALQDFQFHNDNLKSDVFDYQALYKRIHGPKDADALNDHTRQKIENQLPAESLRALNVLESQYYEDRGKDMPFLRWVHAIICMPNIKLLATKKPVFTKAVSCEEITKLQQKIEQLEMQSRRHPDKSCNTHQTTEVPKATEDSSLHTFKEAYLQGFRDSQDSFVMGMHQVSSDKNQQKTVTPIKPGGQAFAAAAEKYPIKTLISRNDANYPDNNKTTLPYKMVGNFFIPDDKIMQVPEVPTFFALPSGNAVVNSALRNHFRIRCATCDK